MKRNKQIIILLSTVLLTSLFIGNFALAMNENNPFTQLWNTIFNIQTDVKNLQTKTTNLQTEINELENTTGTTRTVIKGVFNITANGDVIYSPSSATSRHYKKIDVPQLTLNDMPTIQVFVKPFNEYGYYPSELYRMWKEPSSPDELGYGEGYILLHYKTTNPLQTYDINSEYIIVVVK